MASVTSMGEQTFRFIFASQQGNPERSVGAQLVNKLSTNKSFGGKAGAANNNNVWHRSGKVAVPQKNTPAFVYPAGAWRGWGGWGEDRRGLEGAAAPV